MVLAPWSRLLGLGSLVWAPWSRRLGRGSLVWARFLMAPPLYLVLAAGYRAGCSSPLPGAGCRLPGRMFLPFTHSPGLSRSLRRSPQGSGPLPGALGFSPALPRFPGRSRTPPDPPGPQKIRKINFENKYVGKLFVENSFGKTIFVKTHFGKTNFGKLMLGNEEWD